MARLKIIHYDLPFATLCRTSSNKRLIAYEKEEFLNHKGQKCLKCLAKMRGTGLEQYLTIQQKNS